MHALRFSESLPTIFQMLERDGVLEPVRSFFAQTEPTSAFDHRELPAAAFTFYEDESVQCHALPQVLMWLHADPREALYLQALRHNAALIVAAVWSVGEDGSVSPGLVCAGAWANMIVQFDQGGQGYRVKNELAFHARQRRRAAGFYMASQTAAWVDEALDLARRRLIDRTKKPLIIKAMTYWSFGEGFQLPFLRALLPGICAEMPEELPDESFLRDLELI